MTNFRQILYRTDLALAILLAGIQTLLYILLSFFASEAESLSLEVIVTWILIAYNKINLSSTLHVSSVFFGVDKSFRSKFGWE